MFILVDCNNFFVSCERVFNPHLAGKPVVVLSANDACVVSRSPEAKLLGIPMGAPAFQYKDIIKKHNIIVYSANFALYGDMSQRVMSVLSQFSPQIEIYSIDEAFLEIDTASDLTQFGQRIKNTVELWTGIPVTVGIASTKTLAKAAGEIAKKNKLHQGVLVLPQDNDKFLEQLDVADVWGVGRKYAQKLKSRGITNALRLKNASDNWIKANLTIVGLRKVYELRGISCLSLDSQPQAKKGIITSRSFGTPVAGLADLKEAISTYVSRAAEKLRSQGSLAAWLSVFISTKHYGPGPHYSNSIGCKLSPTQDTGILVRHALGLVEKIYKKGFLYKKAGCWLSNITSQDKVQLGLFLASGSGRLMAAIDKINDRFGEGKIYLASGGIVRAWKPLRAKKSPSYTTAWWGLPQV